MRRVHSRRLSGKGGESTSFGHPTGTQRRRISWGTFVSSVAVSPQRNIVREANPTRPAAWRGSEWFRPTFSRPCWIVYVRSPQRPAFFVRRCAMRCARAVDSAAVTNAAESPSGGHRPKKHLVYGTTVTGTARESSADRTRGEARWTRSVTHTRVAACLALNALRTGKRRSRSCGRWIKKRVKRAKPRKRRRSSADNRGSLRGPANAPDDARSGAASSDRRRNTRH